MVRTTLISNMVLLSNASSSAKWTDSAELANLLNSGILKSTANLSMAEFRHSSLWQGGELYTGFR